VRKVTSGRIGDNGECLYGVAELIYRFSDVTKHHQFVNGITSIVLQISLASTTYIYIYIHMCVCVCEHNGTRNTFFLCVCACVCACVCLCFSACVRFGVCVCALQTFKAENRVFSLR
jgi:hypothetical protein